LVKPFGRGAELVEEESNFSGELLERRCTHHHRSIS
jgi:hypothetical protein